MPEDNTTSNDFARKRFVDEGLRFMKVTPPSETKKATGEEAETEAEDGADPAQD